MNSSQGRRARAALLSIIALGAVLSWSLYSISVAAGPAYAARARAQYARPATSSYDRGRIFFTDKSGVRAPAAALSRGFIVYMNPRLVSDPASAYQAVLQYLKLDRGAFMAKAGRKDDPYEELARRTDKKTADAVAALRLPGIGAVPESWRIYPGGSLASHELGLVGEDSASSTISGRYGLEKYYDGILSRPAAAGSADVFAEFFAGLGGDGRDPAASGQGDIVTSLEPSVQAYLERVLDGIGRAWAPDEAGGIIMDPSTGEIRAMASIPGFDPNDTAGVKNASVFSNPLSEHVYEMGSIMKPLTMAAALDSGAERPDSTYEDTGCLNVNDRKICNYDAKARGKSSMQQILSQSLNVGAATIALSTGAADFRRYLYSFGVKDKTGIDLPSEGAPLTSSLKRGTDIDIATASYGQGLAVSPIGMARALSVLANGGYVVTPRLVREIDYLDGSVKRPGTEKSGPVLKRSTVDAVRAMLVEVVDKSLAGGSIKRERYSVAAKTGTAQIADEATGGYFKDRYLHSFFGFFPAYDPRFLVFLYQVYPKGAQYASETLTRPFDDIAGFLINYYNIPPDR